LISALIIPEISALDSTRKLLNHAIMNLGIRPDTD